MASDLKRKRENEPDEEGPVEPDAEIAKVLVSQTTLWRFRLTYVQKHKLPTGDELRALKDAADLYQSSSFKLQVCTKYPFIYTCSLNTSLD